MRKLLGVIFVVSAVILTYEFAALGTLFAKRPEPGVSGAAALHAGPFLGLGRNYPTDAALLAVVVWAFGVGLMFLLREAPTPVAPQLAPMPGVPMHASTAAGGRPARPLAGMFLINALLLVTVLFLTFVGVRANTHHVRLVQALSLAAGLQVAIGLLLLVMALFEKPRAVVSLLLGFAFYAAGTAISALVFLWGRVPIQGA